MSNNTIKRDYYPGSSSELKRVFYARPFKEMIKWLLLFTKVVVYRYFRRLYDFIWGDRIIKERKNSRDCTSEVKAFYIPSHDYYEIQIGNNTRRSTLLKKDQTFVFEINVGENDHFLFGIAPLIEEFEQPKVLKWAFVIEVTNLSTNQKDLHNVELPYNSRNDKFAYYPGDGWLDIKFDLSKYIGQRCRICIYCLTERLSISCPQVFKRNNHVGRERNVILISIESFTDPKFLKDNYSFESLPAFEELCKESTTYPCVYSPTESTLSFVASMLTGLLPSQHGIGDYSVAADSYRNDVYNRKLISLADFFKRQKFFTSFGGTQVRFSSKVGWSKGFDHYFHVFEKWAPNVPKFDWIMRNVRSLTGFDKFIFFHVDYLHEPLVSFNDMDRARFHDPSYLSNKGDIADVYFAQLKELDYQLGVFISNLKATGIYDNTAIIVTGDHGCGINWAKHSDYALYEERIRVPLIVKYPDWAKEKTKAKKVTNSVCEIHRVIYKMLGCELPDYLLELPQYNQEYRDIAFSETIMNPMYQYKKHNLVIVNHPYKYVRWNEIDWKNQMLEETCKESLYLWENDMLSYNEKISVADRELAALNVCRKISDQFIDKNLNFLKEYPPQKY